MQINMSQVDFFHYQILDKKPMVEQAWDFIMIINKLHLEGIKIKDNLIVCVLINKLPPLWKKCQKTYTPQTKGGFFENFNNKNLHR